MKNILLIILSFILIFSNARAQKNTPRPSVDEIIKKYQNFDYSGAETLAQKALESSANFSPEQLIKIHLYYGCSAFTLGDLSAAKSQFLSLLSLNPDYKLDTVLFSPKIQAFFNSVKSDFLENKNTSNEITYHYVVLKDLRISAIKRSLLLPGWGQTYLGQKKKGKLLMLASIASMTGSLIAHTLTNRAHRNYLSAKEPNIIEKDYQSYRRIYIIRNGLIGITTTIWLYSALDILFQKKPVLKSVPKNWSVLFIPGQHFFISYQHTF